MEKFYIVNESCNLYAEYTAYQDCMKKTEAFGKEFLKRHEIQDCPFAFFPDELTAALKPEDKERFKPQLKICPEALDGKQNFWAFKKNSKIGRAWTKEYKDSEIKWSEKPFVMGYFGGNVYRSRSAVFFLGDTLYCRFEADCEFTPPDGMQEIKASEFFAIAEKYGEA
ncbi:MAG: hypothetical protein PHE09_16625 [Oscillospiraceae bacterium]|nr:hypothetical protein [Oscillospiraceae bacterium]